MEIRILDDRANPLLKRHELRFEVAHATRATPSRDEVRGELSKLVHAPKDRVVVERMAARFGTAVTRGEALVYETADALKSTEREHILVRNRLKEKAPKGPAAATEAPTPAPAKPEAPKPEAPVAEPARGEAPKAEPSKGEPHKGGPHKGEPHEGEPHKSEPHKGEAHKDESHKGKRAKDESTKGEAAQSEPAAPVKKE